ncbi:Protein CBG27647 [Caenorhabditis briggsae]|uniref:Protein CBG27647 n=1 Tax=Caenorhabditis briggsae TaxID=6238 RepID=B6IJ92_CAEBR|nr:Protein CBG27647 [Caenorhabditis briggsae]CAR99926.1 Protein CBG27647 [Caenorhabditis briggsae]
MRFSFTKFQLLFLTPRLQNVLLAKIVAVVVCRASSTPPKKFSLFAGQHPMIPGAPKPRRATMAYSRLLPLCDRIPFSSRVSIRTEFVIMNIPRTFRSNPIPAIFGKYCYHITDVFIEILRHLIFIRGLFQLMMKRLGKLFVTMKEIMN